MNTDYQILIIVNIYLAIAIFQSIKPLPQLTINKKIETLNIKYLRNGEVALSDRSTVLNYSINCSDMYGDAIHLARAIANTFDKTYFDVFDDCPEDIEPRSASNTLYTIVQPNPTSGHLMVQTDKKISGKIEVLDLTGILVYSAYLINQNHLDLDLNIRNGIYFLTIISDNGERYSEKIVVNK